jgi:hypothetical protein
MGCAGTVGREDWDLILATFGRVPEYTYMYLTITFAIFSSLTHAHIFTA